MADKAAQIIVDALSRAVLDPDGVPLHGNKNQPGLFPTTPVAKLAAQRCRDEGLVRLIATETRGKTVHEYYSITEKGLGYLLQEASPKHVLEDFVRALEARQTQLKEMVDGVNKTMSGIQALRGTAEKVLEKLQQGGPVPVAPPGPKPTVNGHANGHTNGHGHGSQNGTWQKAALHHLASWHASASSEDCPLPVLYRNLKQSSPGLTIGHFHDGLRVLYEQGSIYLHPWTGPLYAMPEPSYALLIGHEILYYASLR